MKAYIKGGLFLALGWLANHAHGQDIQFKASTPKTTQPIAEAGNHVRAVTLSLPTLAPAPGNDTTGSATFRPIVRGQKPDEIKIEAIPKLETGGTTGQPKLMPKDPGFTPPPPSPVESSPPSPVFGNLGMGADGCFEGGSGICSPHGGIFGGDCCPQRGRGWISAEYLMWWQRSQVVPPLVATSPAGTPQVNAAIVGVPGNSVLYDSTPLTTRGGGRFTLGRWMPNLCDNLGIEMTFFYIARQNATSTYASDGSVILGRPFTEGGVQNAELFSFPNLASGQTTISNYSQIWGLEGNLRYKWRCNDRCWVDMLGGYRHINLSEGIQLSEDVTFGPGTLSPGLRSVEQESFRTRNQFDGVQFGLDGECRIWNRWFIGATTKVALGNVYQRVDIAGTTTFTNVPAPFGDSTQQGALLASPTNIGRFTQNRFAVVPEVTLKLGYDITDRLRIFAGYNFLYISSVMRPGEQIDTNVNQNFRPTLVGPGAGGGPAVPAVLMRTSDYWAQGLNFGLQYRY
jgi:hypothetical protein